MYLVHIFFLFFFFFFRGTSSGSLFDLSIICDHSTSEASHSCFTSLCLALPCLTLPYLSPTRLPGSK